MVAWIQYFFADNIFKSAQIYHIACIGIGLTCYGNFKYIIMAMPVWVIALPKHIAVPVFRFIGIMQSVGCIKMGFSGYKYQIFRLLLMLKRDNDKVQANVPLNLFRRTKHMRIKK